MSITTTVRIDENTRETLKRLAALAGKSLQDTLAMAVETYRRQAFFDSLNLSAQRLKGNPEAWKAELEERAAWDATLEDDLEEDHWSGRRGRAPKRRRHSSRRTIGNA